MSVFRRRIVFRDNRETRSLGGASIVTASLAAALIAFAGSATGSTTGSTGDASGAVVFGGDPVATLTIEVSGSGSVTFAGSVTGISVSRGTASSAVTFAGTARCDSTASGAIVFAGSATVGSVFTMDASGAIAFAGSAAPISLAAATSSVVFGGTLGVPEIADGTVESAASGVVVLSGTATGLATTALNVPYQFHFETAFKVGRGEVQTSRAETIRGNDQPAALLIENGEYSIDGGAFSSDPTTIAAGSRIRLRHTSSDEYATSTTTTLNLSGVTADFVSITEARLHGNRPPRHHRFFTVPRKRK